MPYSYYDYLAHYYEDVYWPQHYWDVYAANLSEAMPANVINSTWVYAADKQYETPFDMQTIGPIVFGTSVICALLAVVVAARTVYKVCQNSPDKVGNKEAPVSPLASSSTSRCSAAVCLVLSVVAIHVCMCVVDSATWFLWYISYDPTAAYIWYMLIAWDLLYTLCRVSMYVLYTFRFYNLYMANAQLHDGCLYTKSGKIAMFMFLVCIVVVNCALKLLYAYHEYHHAYAFRQYISTQSLFLWMDLLSNLFFFAFLGNAVMQVIVDAEIPSLKQAASQTGNDLSVALQVADEKQRRLPQIVECSREESLDVDIVDVDARAVEMVPVPLQVETAAVECKQDEPDGVVVVNLDDEDKIDPAVTEPMSLPPKRENRKHRKPFLHFVTKIFLTCVVPMLAAVW
eukprot:CAMPEP_0202687748 /NCGR_PEP_ID=MMETSP1385-20130828/3382_1 /ASSEMBLY_ACC=CAM_ASM_000861 /TAXON_ID=933848 /ORGANISM="Elphidium margaritaceum" /LENGTH=398 /DNA_ID=CAMNT_0049342591 /DNA_START=24 /DNA_END=1217 /DNA_ORIENTATION=+